MIFYRHHGAVCLGAAALALGVAEQAQAAPAKHRPAVRVEFGLTAGAATWSPGRGRLSLTDVAPRMTMMTVAPNTQVATVPASLLAANWRALMGKDRQTNAILSAREGDRERRLYPVRLKMVGHAANGERMSFRVTPLTQRGHRGTRLGPKPRQLRDVSVVIDPTVTDVIKAMWAQLLSFFGGGDTPAITPPDSPVAGSGTSARFSTRDGTYAGDDGLGIGTEAGWQSAQQRNLDGAGGDWTGDLTASAPDVRLSGSAYDGVAFFDHDYGRITFDPDASVSITNLAVTGGRVDNLTLNNAEVGGANFTDLQTSGFNVSNSVFDGVDLSGLAITPEGSNQGRSSVENAVFFNVTADAPVIVHGVDFTSVSFQNADLRNSEIQTSTFQGCGLSNVDLSGSRISGPDPSGTDDNRFQPTFDNSILDGVNLDDTTLENVSFAGVDFTGGDVSLDGATLRNVDFTGATGLQFIDWSNVTIDGNVYGLGEFGLELQMTDRSYLRSWTTDGIVPRIDEITGWDIDPDTLHLIDPGTGIRYEENQLTGGYDAIDPTTDRPFADPSTGDPLQVQGDELVNPTTGEHYEIDYFTGTIEE